MIAARLHIPHMHPARCLYGPSCAYLALPWRRWGKSLRWWRSSRGRSLSPAWSRRWARAWCHWCPGQTGRVRAGCPGRSCWRQSRACCRPACVHPCIRSAHRAARSDHWLKARRWGWVAQPHRAAAGGPSVAAGAGVSALLHTGCPAASWTCGRTSPLERAENMSGHTLFSLGNVYRPRYWLLVLALVQL